MAWVRTQRRESSVKPAPFAYEAPTTLSEAVSCLAAHGDEAKVLAGGQSLIPVLALRLARYEALVDLNRVEGLDNIRQEGSTVVVGAMTRQVTVGRDPLLRAAVPALSEATRLIGHDQIRNRGTLGGSVAHGDPAAEYPAVALALDATVTVVGPSGSRTIEAEDLYDGPMSTTLAEDEILTAVAFPVWGPGSGFAVREVARREGDFATAGVVAGVTVSDGRISRVALALFGVGATPQRFRQAEEELLGADTGTVDLADFGRTLAQQLDPPNDVHASTTYRTRVAARLVAEALHMALGTARQEAVA
jgi:carbon-monoxide dehydrogenase medium subunit